MDFSPSPRAAELHDLVSAFVRDEVEPAAREYHRQVTEASADGGLSSSLDWAVAIAIQLSPRRALATSARLLAL